MRRSAGVVRGLKSAWIATILLMLVGCLACPSRQPSDTEPKTSAASSKSPKDPWVAPAKTNNTGAKQATLEVEPPWVFRGGPPRKGNISHKIPAARPSILWRFTSGRPIYASPALDGQGNIYIASLDGFIYRVGPDGTMDWRRSLGGTIYASPALVPGGLVVGSDSDQLVMLERRTGQPVWTFTLGPCPTGPGRGPDTVRCDADSSVNLGHDGTLYVGGDALYALRPDGSLRWRAELGGHAFSSPAIHPHSGALFIGTQANTVEAIGPDGSRRWTYSGKGHFDATPALIDDETLVVGCDDGQLHALSTRDGALRWSVRAGPRPIRSSAAVDEAGRAVVFGADDGQIYAVTFEGRVAWSHATGGPVRSSPVVDRDGRIVVGSQDNQLYALDRAGRLLWRLELGGDIDSSAAVGPGGRIYVGADDGLLYALGTVALDERGAHGAGENPAAGKDP